MTAFTPIRLHNKFAELFKKIPGSFTEGEYRKIIQIAKKKYTFIPFTDYNKTGHNILMRHDVDFSVHRALALAKIEADESVISTYFLWLHSPYYSLFEDEIVTMVEDIINLGHEIGLHFDYEFWALHNPILEDKCHLKYEKAILEDMFTKTVSAFSLHTATTETPPVWERDAMACGMINAGSSHIRDNFDFYSDSNGVWKHGNPTPAIMSGKQNIQLLIHPEWWTNYPNLSTREKVTRCIDGRGRRCHWWYDNKLKELKIDTTNI